jgi:type I restriction enzyme S subunit
MTWQKISLGEIAVKNGGSVDPGKHPDETFCLYSIPAFDLGKPEICKGSLIGSSKKVVIEDDVMISRIVPHIRRSWVVGQKSQYRKIASGEWIVFRSKQIWPCYLKWVLISDEFHLSFLKTVAGVGGSLLRARPSEVYKISIPLPPLPEQRRIAAILDAADALRRKRRAALSELDTLLQTTFIDLFGDPVTNPKGWASTNIDSVSEKVTDGDHHTPQRSSSGFKLLSARNVLDGEIDLVNTDFVEKSEYERMIKRCKPEMDDILISCSGTIGRVSRIKFNEPVVLVRSAALIKPKKEMIHPVFLESVLRTPQLKSKMLQAAKSSSQANLFQKPIKELTIPLPPLPLQHHFAAIVAGVERQKERMRAHLGELDALFASLQQRAFNGDF